MLTAETKILQGNKVIFLSGVVDETTNFYTLLEPLTDAHVRVNVRDIVRLNSSGVKAWIKYFGDMEQQGVHFTFEECSIIVVEQINMIYNFLGKAVIESIFTPYVCSGCSTELLVKYAVQGLKDSQFQLPSVVCPSCGQAAYFDEISEEYFGFLMDI